MKLFCHLCRRLAFKDTCGRCRKAIDAQYEMQLQMIRSLREIGRAHVKYVLVEDNRKQWRH